jgi:hypothetical protein
MPVFKPRNRLVNFRLSEEEFEKLRAGCALTGARSLSDFARAAVMRSVTGAPQGAESGEPALDSRLSSVDRKVSELETRIDQLLRLMNVLERESLLENVGAGVEACAGEGRR